MHWYRIRLVLLGLTLCVVHVVTGTCELTYSDAASLALSSDVVLKGQVLGTVPVSGKLFNHTVLVQKVFKGKPSLRKKNVTIGVFGNAENRTLCIAKKIGVVKGKNNSLFYLRDVGSKPGLLFENVALPHVKSVKSHENLINSIVCEGCGE